MKWLIILTAILFQGVGFAEAHLYTLPELTGEAKVGRMTLYKSSIGISWFVPIAFSPQLRCTDSSGDSMSLCTLQVINALTDQERDQMSELMSSENLKITYFSNVDSRVVSDISERFENVPDLVSGKTLMLNTLQISNGKIPYASIAFRPTKSVAGQIQALYNSTGLGRFVVQFTMHAQETLGYLAFSDGACVRSALLDRKDEKFHSRQIRSLTDQLIKTCGFLQAGYDDADAKAAALVYVRDQLFKSSFTGYSVDVEKANAIRESYTIYNVVYPSDLSCEGSIDLKAGALPMLSCKLRGER